MNNTINIQEAKWYNKPPFIVAVAVLFFPLGLLLVWRSKHIKLLWKVAFSLIIATYGLILVAATVAVNSPETQSQIKHEDSLVEARKKSNERAINTPVNRQIVPYFNADTLQVYYSKPPFNYYFKKHDDVGRYSTFQGYASKYDAESDGFKNKIVEIQFDPETHEIYRAKLIVRNLHTIYIKLSDLKLPLQFVSVVSPDAAKQFERNFSKIFGDYLNDTPIDSNKYYDNSKNIAIGIDDNFDLIAKKEVEMKEAHIDIDIENTGHTYQYNAVR